MHAHARTNEARADTATHVPESKSNVIFDSEIGSHKQRNGLRSRQHIYSNKPPPRSSSGTITYHIMLIFIYFSFLSLSLLFIFLTLIIMAINITRYEAQALITENRLQNAISKVGAVDGKDKQKLRAVLEMLVQGSF